ncbi:MAG: 2-isopropylmalate synthase [Deltaproteobacteria bacterium]|nr:2-isopropylmalate synthase [Deltaproteobacteria bacterium]
MNPGEKYRPYLSQFAVNLPQRTWPNNQITKAPLWCSVDLRDGNQALINPMNLQQKLEFFDLLVQIGFKEIEIGFPSASAVEYEFTRTLITQKLIPDDVTPQVLTQSRDHLIEKTFESLKGALRAIVHLYNPTSELQRRVVFGKGKDAIKQIAVDGTRLIKRLAAETDTEIVFEYSPESFTGTELDYSVEVCQAVIDEWQPSTSQKMIINLPATVEMATPNVYADQIEYFLRQIKGRESIILSLHPHNDRGTAVAAAELALMAGGERVEGTLFGNGERTGNVDIVTLALNLYSQGIDPQLDLTDINRIIGISEKCTAIAVGPRHPYAGELVFTAFSGSHQDAIRKGMLARGEEAGTFWEVPYLPIDPDDVGRKYEPIIRINSQSGKGGVAYRMETDYGFALPKAMHPEFSAVVQKISDSTGMEVTSKQIWEAFSKAYLELDRPYKFLRFHSMPLLEDGTEGESDRVKAVLKIEVDGAARELEGAGNGPIDACKDALLRFGCKPFKLTDFVEHALSSGSDAEAAAYIQIESEDGRRVYGVGQDPNTTKASIKGLLCAINRSLQR